VWYDLFKAVAETDQANHRDMIMAVLPLTPSTDYAARWEAVATTLREQAAQFDFSQDRRDALYWEIVNPLLEEVECIASSA